MRQHNCSQNEGLFNQKRNVIWSRLRTFDFGTLAQPKCGFLKRVRYKDIQLFPTPALKALVFILPFSFLVTVHGALFSDKVEDNGIGNVWSLTDENSGLNLKTLQEKKEALPQIVDSPQEDSDWEIEENSQADLNEEIIDSPEFRKYDFTRNESNNDPDTTLRPVVTMPKESPVASIVYSLEKKESTELDLPGASHFARQQEKSFIDFGYDDWEEDLPLGQTLGSISNARQGKLSVFTMDKKKKKEKINFEELGIVWDEQRGGKSTHDENALLLEVGNSHVSVAPYAPDTKNNAAGIEDRQFLTSTKLPLKQLPSKKPKVGLFGPSARTKGNNETDSKFVFDKKKAPVIERS